MKVVVVYWTDYDIGETVHCDPICPWRAVEFEDQQQAIGHLKADYYRNWKNSRDVYSYSFQHIKHFAKILDIQPPEPPRTSLYPPGTITH